MFKVFIAKRAYTMLQEVKVQKVPVVTKLYPQMTEMCSLSSVHEMIKAMHINAFMEQYLCSPLDQGSDIPVALHVA